MQKRYEAVAYECLRPAQTKALREMSRRSTFHNVPRNWDGRCRWRSCSTAGGGARNGKPLMLRGT